MMLLLFFDEASLKRVHSYKGYRSDVVSDTIYLFTAEYK